MRRLLPALTLVAVGVSIYAPSLSVPFIFDDPPSIVDNPSIRSLWPPWGPLDTPPGVTVTGRPVVNLTLALNYALGGVDVRGYHAFNLALHLVSTLLLLAIVRRTLAGPGLAPSLATAASGLAFLIALLWMVHPLQSEAVTYVIQRTELLMGAFYLLTLYASIRAWEPARRRTWSAVAVAACALGMGSKEVMVTAPVMVVLYDRVFRASGGWRWRLYAGLAATWLVLAAAAWRGRPESVGFHLGVSSTDHLWTQAGVILWYLRLCLWPHPLSIAYDWPIARSLAGLPHVLAIATLVVTTLWALRRHPPIGFLGAWFFLLLAPTSSVVPIVTEVAAERRMYLPLAAVLTVLVVGGYVLIGRIAGGAAAPVGRGLGAALVAGLAAMTMARQHDYRSELAIWHDAYEKYPDNAVTRAELADALAAEGRVEEAIALYEQALTLQPRFADAHNNLGGVLARAGRLEEAASHYQQALRLEPGLAAAHVNLADALTRLGRLDEAVVHYRAALAREPERADAHNNLGVVLARQGKLAEAIVHYEEALRLDHPWPAVLGNLALAHDEVAAALAREGRFEEARASAERAAELAERAGRPELAEAMRVHVRTYAEAARPRTRP